MNIKDYYQAFPIKYFGDQEEKVVNNLVKGENVLVCAPSGFALKTFINLFLINYFHSFNILEINLELEEMDNVQNKIQKWKEHSGTNLVILYYVDNLTKNSFEKLFALQFNNKKLVYLCFSHLEPLKNPLKYTALTDTFFKRFELLSAFNESKTRQAIEINNKFFNFNILKKDYETIFLLSGGIPRFIKYICLNISEKKFAIGEELSNLYYDPSILYQLNYLTTLLLTEDAHLLKMVGILNKEGKIISLLLKDYFAKYIPEYIKNLSPSLTDYELKILTYLYANKNKLVTFEKIGDLINMNDFNYSLWAIYKQISRLKPKVKNKFIIESVRSSGYLLKEV